MTNEIDVALPLPDHDRSIAAYPVSVAATIAPHRRRCRFPSQKIHTRNTCAACRVARVLRELREKPASRLARRSRIDSFACNRFSCRRVFADGAIG
ncbi:hypothetical protein [Burkholderia sp. YIM B11467]